MKSKSIKYIPFYCMIIWETGKKFIPGNLVILAQTLNILGVHYKYENCLVLLAKAVNIRLKPKLYIDWIMIRLKS